MFRTFFSTVLIFLSYTAFSQPAVEQILNNPALRTASVGISVVDISTGRNVMSYNSEKSLTPASVLKLVTTATALELLGDNFRYKTEVAFDLNDPSRILVIGSGDPTLGSDKFRENPNVFFVNSVQQLRKSLSRNIDYSIYVVDDLFGYDGVAPAWTWIDMGNYYASGSYGISVFDNSYRLFFNTTDVNNVVILRTEPHIEGLTFKNELTTNNTGRDNGYIYGAPFSYDRAVRGNIPGGRSSFNIRGDIPDPGLLLGQTLADYLKKEGYEIAKVETARDDYISKNRSPLRAETKYKVGQSVFTQMSRPLKEIVREINVESNNHFAEHVLRTIGVKSGRKNINDNVLIESTEIIGELWKSKGVDISSLNILDGSGLAPQNAVSPEFITDLLSYMYNDSRYSDAFIDSLPKAGQEGTLRSFMTNTKYNGKIVAKSGSIGGVQCYAGYLIDGDKKYAFSVMINKFNGTRAQVRSAIERFLQSL